MYFSVGYPLGWKQIKENPQPEIGALIELKNKYIQLTLDQSMTYVYTAVAEKRTTELTDKINKMGFSYDDVKSELNELLEMNIIVEVNSEKDFWNKLGVLKPVRQGTSTIIEESFKKAEAPKDMQFCICLALGQVPVTDLQLKFWRNANGRKTMSEILSEDFTDYSISDFMQEILHLKANTAFFLV